MRGFCAEIRSRFEAYVAETLEAFERRAVREHLAGCRPCREEAKAFHPAFLFSSVRSEDVSGEDVERILSAVRTGIALKTAERKLGGSFARRRLGVVAGATAVVALTLLFPGARPPRAGRPVPKVALMERETRPAPANVEERFAPANLPDWPAEAGLAKAGSGPGQKFPADATIYDWNPGGGEPRVVWIVDRSLDI